MSEYMALYRKWRPLTFDDVIGQDKISETLKNSIKTGKIAHAYLFCGTRGTGKTTSAKIFSRAVNCENPKDGNPCNECASCKGILTGSILDVYEMDAASNSGVNNIRELRDGVIYSPADCKYKVYIIDEAHMLSSEAFNALLKTLEEPPKHVIFILATTEPESIIPTILSRCQRFDFRRISPDIISNRIEKIAKAENISITPDAAELIAELADGSMRDGLSILEQCFASKPDGLKKDDVLDITGTVDSKSLFDIADAISKNSSEYAIKTVNEVLAFGKEVVCLFEELISHFRALLICKTGGDIPALLEKTVEASKKYEEQASNFSTSLIMYCINVLGEDLLLAKKLPTPRTAIDMAIIKMCSPEYSSDSSALCARISALEKKLKEISHGNIAPKNNTSEKKEAPEKSEEKPVIKTTKKEAKQIDGDAWSLWPDAIKKIKEESKTLYTFLFNAEAFFTGNEIELILSNSLAFSRISTPEGKEYLSKLFSQIQGTDVKVVLKEKGSEKKSSSSPSIFDITAKKELLGDKMTIIEN